jgi:hypothetical protein
MPIESALSKKKSVLTNIIFLLCLFPFFKVIPFIDAEVQPIAAVFSVVYIFFNLKKIPKYLVKPLVLYLILLILLLGYSFQLVSIDSIKMANLIESFAIFIAPLAVFTALAGRLRYVSVKLFSVSVSLWFLLSFFQLLFPSILDSLGISSILELSISRYSSSAFGGGRGVGGFSSEPSYAAQIIVFMLVYSCFLYKHCLIHKKMFWGLLIQIVFMIFANRSGSILLMAAVFMIPYYALKSIKSLKLVIQSVSLLILAIGVLPYTLSYLPNVSDFRMYQVMSDAASAFSGSSGGINLVEFENSQGSLRNISIQVGYLNIFRTGGLGSGIGGWGSDFLNAMEDVGFPINSVVYFSSDPSLVANKKPFAYASLLSFDTGLLGLLSFSSILLISAKKRFRVGKNQRSKKVDSLSMACFIYALFGLFLNSPSSLPIPWLIFLLFMYAPLKVGNSITSEKTIAAR